MMHPTIKLLLVDEDSQLLDTLEYVFEDHGYLTARASTLAEAMQQIDRDTFQLVITAVLDPDPVSSLLLTQSLQDLAHPTPTGLLTRGKLAADIPGLDTFAFVISKPLSFQDFLARVDETLALPLDEVAAFRLQLVQRYFAAFEPQNWEGLAQVCHPDMRYFLQPLADPIAGRDAYIAYARDMFTHTHLDFHFIKILCFPFPNGITARYSSRWRNAQGYPEYGMGCIVFRFLEDKIVRVGVDAARNA